MTTTGIDPSQQPLIYRGNRGGQVQIFRDITRHIGRVMDEERRGEARKSRRLTLDISAEFADGIVGVTFTGTCTGPKERDYEGGQIDDAIREWLDNGLVVFDTTSPTQTGGDWDQPRLERALDLWRRLHLNTMKPGCAHQPNDDWGKWDDVITLTHFEQSPKFRELAKRVEKGEATTAEYSEYQALRPAVSAAWVGIDSPLHVDRLTPASRQALEAGWVAVKEPVAQPRYMHERTSERRGSVSFRTHPDGWLSRPCAVCGYKYGNAHTMHPLTAEDRRAIEEVFTVVLPPDKEPAEVPANA